MNRDMKTVGLERKMADYDGKEPSMTTAATPDDGTSRR